MDPSTLREVRRDYGDQALRRADLPVDPLQLLTAWLDAAHRAGTAEPNAMALATCGADGQPHCRMVLLKGADAAGLRFFTNRDSDKGRQLRDNPRAAVTFWWTQPQARQVRIAGRVQPLADAEADDYFRTRPRAAQVAAAASRQSQPLRNRQELEQRAAAILAGIGDGPVPRPADWGGYLLVPTQFEFWQGRDHRLHDRFRYQSDGGSWQIQRLAP